MTSDGPVRPQNPFPGLRPFHTDDGGLFFGRDRHIEDLLERLRTQRFLGVVGTSGAGKSSLVRAGLLPALYEGFLTSSGSEWRIGIMRPGEDPIDALAAELAKPNVLGLPTELTSTLDASSVGLVETALRAGLQKDENLLIVVDQFEELFRYPSEKTERAVRFVERLLAASATERANIYVILTMRSDYLGECARFPGLAEKLNGGQYLIPRLTRDEMHEAIEGPVLVGGANITPTLVEQLLNDSGNEPDQLPLLQHTLSRIWEIWNLEGAGTAIEVRHYRDPRIQSMKQALDLSASALLAELPGDNNQRIARLLFRRITDRASGKRDTRRPTKVSEILALTGTQIEPLQMVYNHFARTGANFIQASPEGPLAEESILDISHETLIANWSTLRQWAEQEADYAREYRRLTHAARAKDSFFVTTVRSYVTWQVHLLADLCGNFPGGKTPEVTAIALAIYAPMALVVRLISKEKLKDLTGQITKHRMRTFLMILRGLVDPSDSPLAIWAARYTYAEENFRQAFRHLYRQYRNAGLRLIAYYLAIISIILVVAYIFEERRSSRQTEAALQAQVVKANAANPPTLLSNAIKAIEATQAGKPVIGAIDVLKSVTLAAPSRVLQGHTGSVFSVSWSPDGTKLASEDTEGSIGIWNLSSDKPVAMAEDRRGVYGLAWTRDGSEIVVPGNGQVELWSIDPLRRSAVLTKLPGGFAALSWSKQGEVLAEADYLGHITIWSQQRLLHTFEVTSEPVLSLAWHPSLPTLAVGYWNRVEIWDADHALRVGVIPVTNRPLSLTWDDSGRFMAICGEWANVLEITLTPNVVAREVGPHLKGRCHVAWGQRTATSERVKLLALALGDQPLKVFRIFLEGKYELVTELGQAKLGVNSLSWSPDGRFLAAGGEEAKINIYPLDVLDAKSTEDWLAAARGRLHSLRGY